MSRRGKAFTNGIGTSREYDIVEPRAAAMIESLRAFGYTLPAAIADLIGNSVSAGARNVWLNFEWNGDDSFVSIADDGHGMTPKQLIDAMRPGSQNPLDDRNASDLGRFGLGLKTASFSQCRRMTVCSRTKGGRRTVRCWDLDYVNRTEEWRLPSEVDSDTLYRLTQFDDRPKGTIVLWEVLDRIVCEVDADGHGAQQRFLELIDDVETHLGMVFHRFMAGLRALRIYINGTDKQHLVKAWDPFLEDHSATQQFPPERIRFKGTAVTATVFILPHHDKLEKESFEATAGPRGWNAHQGFYVYRNKRLLVPGDWLGFRFTKEEHYKLVALATSLATNYLAWSAYHFRIFWFVHVHSNGWA